MEKQENMPINGTEKNLTFTLTNKGYKQITIPGVVDYNHTKENLLRSLCQLYENQTKNLVDGLIKAFKAMEVIKNKDQFSFYSIGGSRGNVLMVSGRDDLYIAGGEAPFYVLEIYPVRKNGGVMLRIDIPKYGTDGTDMNVTFYEYNSSWKLRGKKRYQPLRSFDEIDKSYHFIALDTQPMVNSSQRLGEFVTYKLAEVCYFLKDEKKLFLTNIKKKN